MRLELGVKQQLTTDFNSQPSPRFGDCHRARGGIILLLTNCTTLIVVDHLLGEKTSVTIYFCLIKYHRDNIIKIMSEKASFLKKLMKNIYMKMVALPRGLLQIIISLDYLSF
jgi:hypothetical protein